MAGHGGIRTGAGRPTQYGEPKERVTLSLSPELVARLDAARDADKSIPSRSALLETILRQLFML